MFITNTWTRSWCFSIVQVCILHEERGKEEVVVENPYRIFQPCATLTFDVVVAVLHSCLVILKGHQPR